VNKLLALVAPTILVAACVSSPLNGSTGSSSSSAYWRGASSSVAEFRRDNVVCSNRAARAGNVAQMPDNRIDRPMQKWANAAAQEAYESCMLQSGWQPVS
jgi:hypothetical protein